MADILLCMETIKAHIQLQIKLKGKGRFKCYKLGYMFSWLAICFHGCKLGGKIFVGLFVKL
jgi:hypothetical protein